MVIAKRPVSHRWSGPVEVCGLPFSSKTVLVRNRLVSFANESGRLGSTTWEKMFGPLKRRMVNFLSQLTKSEQATLLEELNYMNLEEIRGFCSGRGIPYRIVAEYANGKVRATKDTDRKPIVLARIRRYLTTGQVGRPTCIPAQIVREENPPAQLGPRDRLYYRW